MGLLHYMKAQSLIRLTKFPFSSSVEGNEIAWLNWNWYVEHRMHKFELDMYHSIWNSNDSLRPKALHKLQSIVQWRSESAREDPDLLFEWVSIRISNGNSMHISCVSSQERKSHGILLRRKVGHPSWSIEACSSARYDLSLGQSFLEGFETSIVLLCRIASKVHLILIVYFARFSLQFIILVKLLFWLFLSPSKWFLNNFDINKKKQRVTPITAGHHVMSPPRPTSTHPWHEFFVWYIFESRHRPRHGASEKLLICFSCDANFDEAHPLLGLVTAPNDSLISQFRIRQCFSIFGASWFQSNLLEAKS